MTQEPRAGRGLGEVVRDLRRAAAWHRRLLAAGLAAAAVAFGLQAVAPAPPRLVPMVVAARDLTAGIALGAHDVVVRRVPPDTVPAGAVATPAPVLGRVLAAPVRRDEGVTDVRLVGRALLATLPPGHVATPVRVADAGAAALVRAGDVVDLVAAEPSGGDGRSPPARTVAAAARVLAVSVGTDAATSEGGLLLVDVDTDTGVDLARAAVSARLSVLLRPG